MKEDDGQAIYDHWKKTEKTLMAKWTELSDELKITEAANIQRTIEGLWEGYKTNIMLAACLKYLGVETKE